MKRLSAFLLFAFLATLVVAIPAHAADLQAGWYAKAWSPYLWQYDQQGNLFIRAEGYFYDTPVGQYGPFSITGSDIWRNASVLTTAYGVGPDASLIMPLTFGVTLGEPIAYLSLPWETDYDSSQIRLEFWRTRYSGAQELLWAQTQSGSTSGGATVLANAEYEGQFFVKLTVIPEPTSVTIFTAGLAALSAVKRRRR